jgi:hypothetical protein
MKGTPIAPASSKLSEAGLSRIALTGSTTWVECVPFWVIPSSPPPPQTSRPTRWSGPLRTMPA